MVVDILYREAYCFEISNGFQDNARPLELLTFRFNCFVSFRIVVVSCIVLELYSAFVFAVSTL